MSCQVGYWNGHCNVNSLNSPMGKMWKTIKWIRDYKEWMNTWQSRYIGFCIRSFVKWNFDCHIWCSTPITNFSTLKILFSSTRQLKFYLVKPQLFQVGIEPCIFTPTGLVGMTNLNASAGEVITFTFKVLDDLNYIRWVSTFSLILN